MVGLPPSPCTLLNNGKNMEEHICILWSILDYILHGNLFVISVLSHFTCQNIIMLCSNVWMKVFKNGPSKICGRQPLKHLKWYGLLKWTIIADHITSNFLKAVSHTFYLVHSEYLDPYGSKLWEECRNYIRGRDINIDNDFTFTKRDDANGTNKYHYID